MVAYMEILGIPLSVIVVIVAVLFTINIIGELLEFKGKAVPEFIKFRKYFARKKTERETMKKIPEVLDNVQKLLDDVDQHYSKDNIARRDDWMRQVNDNMKEFNDIKNIVLDIQINTKRRDIIEFANRAIDKDIPISEEEYERIFALHDEYDNIIKENGLTNGQVNVSYDLIKQSYEERAKSHAFIEYSTGYRKK